ncbi:class I SAM-dependent methyltransferase [Virgibacillus halodenitrificans]|uniref:hypothetical protein n=1 Tax=Virgibacillus halodenitrificans TaxID=1482 RepID=UPI001F349B81|nr:hypothetical protein [Virgibacillus halodenitrificans]
MTVIQEDLKLQNVDEQLISDFDKLLPDAWDFKGENVRSLTHGLHNYPATMVFPIARQLLDMISKYHDVKTLLDPFMGSGTSLVEGYLADLESVYGTDLNPLARMMSKVKTTPIDPEELNLEINNLFTNIDYNYNLLVSVIVEFDKQIKNEYDITDKKGWGSEGDQITRKFLKEKNIDMNIPYISNLGYWFLPHVVLELQLIKNLIKQVESKKIRNFFWVCFSEVVRLSSNRRNGEFKMYRMAKEKLESYSPNVLQIFMNQVQKNEEKMKDFYKVSINKQVNTQVNIYNNNAMELNDVPDNSIDITITSPPYGDSRTTVAYGQFSRTALEWLDLHEDFEDEKAISQKDIRAIDKKLLGGTVEKKFKYDLSSPTLGDSINKIMEKDEKRALDVYSFYKDLDKTIEAITRKMKINSYQCWVVGNRTVKEEQLQTHQIIKELGEQYGLVNVAVMGRNIPNKVMPNLNSPTNKSGQKITTMTNELIVILRKKR